MEQNKKPRVKVMCLFLHNGKVLAGKGYEKAKGETFYRLMGGNLELGETSEDGIRRETREELGCEIENLTLVKVVENIFAYEGNPGHDIVFLYKGDLSKKELYEQNVIKVVEPHAEYEAEWVSVPDVLANKVILYPTLNYEEVLK